MSKRKPVNMAASVHKKLMDRSRALGEDSNLILVRYAAERLLYRLTRSKYADQFVLKGALLFAVWIQKLHRPTKDLDLLGFGEATSTRLTTVFQTIGAVQVEDDGLQFDPKSVHTQEIREDQEYQGKRVQLVAYLGKARIPVQIDIGFGDVVTPAAVEIDFPTLLAMPTLRIRSYPRETVVAEKFQAMVALGMQNSRMKDYFDLWVLARTFTFQGSVLSQAIRATFDRRRTPIPTNPPLALSSEFGRDSVKRIQWNAFSGKIRHNEPAVDLNEVVEVINGFVMPPVGALAEGKEFERFWPAGGPWGKGTGALDPRARIEN